VRIRQPRLARLGLAEAECFARASDGEVNPPDSHLTMHGQQITVRVLARGRRWELLGVRRMLIVLRLGWKVFLVGGPEIRKCLLLVRLIAKVPFDELQTVVRVLDDLCPRPCPYTDSVAGLRFHFDGLAEPG
jgi:hypothetical protein